MPRRPSGADKKQKAAKKLAASRGTQCNAGHRRRVEPGSQSHLVLSALVATNRHFTSSETHDRPKPLTDGCQSVSNGVLDEKARTGQRQIMVSNPALLAVTRHRPFVSSGWPPRHDLPCEAHRGLFSIPRQHLYQPLEIQAAGGPSHRRLRS